MNMAKLSRLRGVQGKAEQCTESYMKYDEGVAQVLTPQSLKSASRVTSSARQQTGAARRFGVFDIDGTLLRWQLYHVIVDKLAKAGFLGDKAHEQLHIARMVWKNRTHVNSFTEYEQKLIAVFDKALTRVKTDDFDNMVGQIIAEYQDQVYTYPRDVIKRLKKKGYFLMAISGSPQELVEKFASHYGFDVTVGAEYERKNGKFTGQKFLPISNKRSVLEKLIDEHALTLDGSVGIGDTKSDISMLRVVERPIAFNPDRVLFKYARQQGWPIVTERKNVVYNLESQNGRYILV